jgi:hypothetical protein
VSVTERERGGRRHRREEGERGRWREDEGGREGDGWVKRQLKRCNCRER